MVGALYYTLLWDESRYDHDWDDGMRWNGLYSYSEMSRILIYRWGRCFIHITYEENSITNQCYYNPSNPTGYSQPKYII
jgi:hypothetical protein